MELCISRRQYEQLLKWASDAGQRECCGLIMGQDNCVQELLLADNVAKRPATHFEIEPAALIAAEKMARAGGPAILGHFHSHPNGIAQPSITDAGLAASDGRYWVVITLDMASAWKAVDKGALHDRFDPVRLIICNESRG